MFKLIDKDDPQFEDFCEDICSQCINAEKGCYPLAPNNKCCCFGELDEARTLLSKLRYIEDDPDHLYGTSPDDVDYNFDAQSRDWDTVDEKLNELKKVIINDVGENLVEYYQYFGYEM
ncbi:MAG: hypothetical protein IJP85_05830 [Synergistaceae bacterium]|nr:hypothetical protein [Synergistaceae bacterium]